LVSEITLKNKNVQLTNGLRVGDSFEKMTYLFPWILNDSIDYVNSNAYSFQDSDNRRGIEVRFENEEVNLITIYSYSD